MMKRLGFVAAALLWASAALAQTTGPATVTGYPVGSQPFAVSGSGTTSASVTITQPPGYQHTYIASIAIQIAGATTATTAGSVTNLVAYPIPNPPAAPTLVGGTLALSTGTSQTLTFSPPVPNNGSNVVVTAPTNTGALATALTVTGYFY